jgi:hypothetical protein
MYIISLWMSAKEWGRQGVGRGRGTQRCAVIAMDLASVADALEAPATRTSLADLTKACKTNKNN